ncbi:MAG: ATP-binding protein [Bacteroidetes bacterium]|nr:ATP-binding protein [Bacteroidota bacterium]
MNLKFIAHARLKDIIGRGLINNDNIAMIELIKNSRDADSDSVSIEFRESDILYISDHGEGMSMEDIRYKWLNIAYSVRKNANPLDGGAYAGNKGIGRFSCDRLGKKLNLYTKAKDDRYITLEINWPDFEQDDRDVEIGHIETVARYITPLQFQQFTNLEPFDHGTVLAISHLRSEWSEDKLKSLRRELERFVIAPEKRFEVQLHHHGFDDDHEINAPIENKIFEELDFRTSSIKAEIDEEGNEIHISLRHDGDYIFRSTEKNTYPQLKNIQAIIYFLNQPAKAFFKRHTGYHSVQYGSIFLFLNSFRVFPYGSEGDDWLSIDRRRQQGQKRFFGTRDLVGFIKVSDHEDLFIPVSSREGLVQNKAYHQLTSFAADVPSSLDGKMQFGLFHKIMRKLEKFVVDGLDWDRIVRTDISDEKLIAGEVEYLQTNRPVFETIDSIIQLRSSVENIKELSINLPHLSKIAHQETEDYQKLVTRLEKKFSGTSIDTIKPHEKRNLSEFISRQAKELAAKEQTTVELEKKESATKKKLATEQKRRLFAEFESNIDQNRMLQLHHQINLIAGSLWKHFDGTARRVRKDPSKYSKEDLFEIIQSGIFEINRIRNVTKLALKADFDLMTNKVKEDLIQFIQEYLENYKEILSAWNLQMRFTNENSVQLIKAFRPIEVTVLIDNLLVNSGKAGAKTVNVRILNQPEKTMIEFVDDGNGLTDRFAPSDLFEKGISTTSGAGIGLNHSQRIIQDLGGTIKISNATHRGAKITIEFDHT